MSNLSILEQNILLGIESEEGQKLFLKFKDRDVLKAERCAWELDRLVPWIDWLLPLSCRALIDQQPNNPHLNRDVEEVFAGVKKFILDRHRYWRYPQTSSAGA